MKIPPNAIIPPEKLRRYLLVPRKEDDKSRFLAQADFTRRNAGVLETALRDLIAHEEAIADRVDAYGTFYQVAGHLQGPNGQKLPVITIWLHEQQTGQYRFITLKPWR